MKFHLAAVILSYTVSFVWLPNLLIQFSLTGLLPVHCSQLFNRSPSTKLIIWLSEKEYPTIKGTVVLFSDRLTGLLPVHCSHLFKRSLSATKGTIYSSESVLNDFPYEHIPKLPNSTIPLLNIFFFSDCLMSMLLFSLSTQRVSFNWMCHCFIAV